MLDLLYTLDAEIDLREEVMPVYPLEEMQRFYDLKEQILDTIKCNRDMLLQKGCGCLDCDLLIEEINSISPNVEGDKEEGK